MLSACRALLLAVLAAPVIPSLPAGEKDIDLRRAARSGPGVEAGFQHTAALLERLSARLGPRLMSSMDESGRLRSLARYTPPLSGPDPRDPEAIARRFASEHFEVLGLAAGDAGQLELIARDRSGPNHLLRFRQRWHGIPVFLSDLRVHVTPAVEVVELQFDLEAPVAPVDPPPIAPSLPPEAAARVAAADLDPLPGLLRAEVLESLPSPRRDTRILFGPNGDEVLATQVWFPSQGNLRLAWHLDALSTDATHYYECVVDARDGTLLFRGSITDSDTFGLVFDPSPQPSPTPGTLPAAVNPPPLVQRERRLFAGDPAASRDGWLGPEGETMGNNVIAREDKAGDNESTLGATAKARGGSFDFDLALGPGAPSPVNFSSAAVTNLFYWCNLLHDYYYALGFTEAAGNFQESNFGRGGLEQDALRADAQDGAERTPPNLNNANMSTPNDGSRPRMQMYLWGSPGGPYVDSDFDAEVIAHEYTHGVFRRLTPTAGGVQGGAMHEGVADFMALNYLVPASAPPDGSFVAGGYSRQDFVRGIRTRPYSTKYPVNDLSYADFGRVIGGPEVHADGEIWCATLMELRSLLMKRLGYAEGKRRVAQLVIDGMKRSPANPSYIDMRDALIAADEATNRGEDVKLIWEAFARRGMGFMAAGGSGSSLNVLPSQELPSPAARILFHERVYYQGETVRILVGDANNGGPLVSLQVETASGDRETIAAPRNGAVFTALINPLPGPAVPGDGRLQLGAGDTIRVSYLDTDDGTGRPLESRAEVPVRPEYFAATEPAVLITAAEAALNLKGDNVSTRYSLPFGFPFYDRIVTALHIATNGLVTIGAAGTSPSNSPSALGALTAIAPLWDDLRTNGAAQTAEDVYVARPTPDSVRIRWVAETVKRDNTGALLAGDPVNFAVTLWQSGRIQFWYGSGNRSVTPTVGISRGTETLFQVVPSLSSTTASISLENAPAVGCRFPGNSTVATIMPFYRAGGQRYTGFALVNTDSGPADVLFTAHPDGQQSPSVAPQSVFVARGEQQALVGQQIFPGATGFTDGWLEARATTDRISMFYVHGDNDQTYLAGAIPPRAARDLVIPYAPADSGTARGPDGTLHLVNAGAQPANAEVRLRDGSGAQVASANLTLAPGASYLGRLSFLLATPSPGSPGGHLRIGSDRDIAAVAAVEKAGLIRFVPAREPSPARMLYAPQFASGETGGVRYYTELNVVNYSDDARHATFLLRDNEGKPLSGPSIRNPVTVSLEPRAGIRVRGEALFGLPDPIADGSFFEGSLIIEADGPGLTGDVTFGDAASGRFEATLPLDTAPRDELLFSHVAEGTAGTGKPYFTGLAFYNPGETGVIVTIEVRNRRGLIIGTADLPLKPHARAARTVGQIVPGIAQVGGYIRVKTTGGPVAAVCVYGTSALDLLVAVPPQGLTGAGPP